MYKVIVQHPESLATFNCGTEEHLFELLEHLSKFISIKTVTVTKLGV